MAKTSAKKNAGGRAAETAVAAASGVLLILGAAQFLMVLDTSVMNVSIATVAEDVGTTIAGIQGAITLFTLVMATLMITGGKIGNIIGRRRAFSIGLVIYACGSLTTALAPNLTVLLIGWSLLEGIGAALIMPAIVALVAGNVTMADRPKAYGQIAAAGAIAVAIGPLIGGFATTFFSWRWVFAGEVVIAIIILVMARRLADSPVLTKTRLDLVGTLLTIVGLGAFVYGVLRSGEWGWVTPKSGAPTWLGISLTTWLILFGLLVIWLFGLWEQRVAKRGGEPLVQPGTLKNAQLSGGLVMFFFQYLLQGGYFFIIPLFLSVVLELNALQTGVRLVPLSLVLIVAALGIPKLWPQVSPKRVVRVGVFLMLAGLLSLLAGIDLDADAAIVTVPMVLMGLGMGALASQLGSVTVSALPNERSGEVGGLQNTASNLGIPKLWPQVSPKRVVRVGVFLMLAGLLSLLAGIDLDADAAVVTVPMVLMGLGMGALASQLGSVTVSALPNERSGEVGGLQNTASNLGISIGTAIAGSVLIAALTTSMISGIHENPQVPAEVKSQASVQLAGGVPFISDTDLEAALTEAGVSAEMTEAVVEENRAARIAGLHSAIMVLAILAMVSLFFTGYIPNVQPGETAEKDRPKGQSL